MLYQIGMGYSPRSNKLVCLVGRPTIGLYKYAILRIINKLTNATTQQSERPGCPIPSK